MASGLLHRKGVEPPHRLIVVQRQRYEVLRALLDAAERWPAGTAVMLDRRRGDRRQRTQGRAIERRDGPRRTDPDPTWYTHGFIVVEVTVLPMPAILLPAPRCAPPRS